MIVDSKLKTATPVVRRHLSPQGRMRLSSIFALARFGPKLSEFPGAVFSSRPKGYSSPPIQHVTMRWDGVRELPVPRRTARKLRSHR